MATTMQSLPWFSSGQYELKLQIAALSQGYDHAVTRGDIMGRRFATLYLKAGQLFAADCMNPPKEFMLSKQGSSMRLSADPSILSDDSIDIKSLVAA